MALKLNSTTSRKKKRNNSPTIVTKWISIDLLDSSNITCNSHTDLVKIEEGRENKLCNIKQYAAFHKTGRETLLGTSAYEKLQCNEDILARRNVITGAGRGECFLVRRSEMVLSSELLLLLISSLWHEGGAVAPPV